MFEITCEETILQKIHIPLYEGIQYIPGLALHVHCSSTLVNIVNVFKICPINQPPNAPLESDRSGVKRSVSFSTRKEVLGEPSLILFKDSESGDLV